MMSLFKAFSISPKSSLGPPDAEGFFFLFGGVGRASKLSLVSSSSSSGKDDLVESRLDPTDVATIGLGVDRVEASLSEASASFCFMSPSCLSLAASCLFSSAIFVSASPSFFFVDDRLLDKS